MRLCKHSMSKVHGSIPFGKVLSLKEIFDMPGNVVILYVEIVRWDFNIPGNGVKLVVLTDEILT